MGRRLRTTLVCAPRLLNPKEPEMRKRDQDYKDRAKRNHDERHQARNLPPVRPGQEVYVRDREELGTVEREAEGSPRSVVINTRAGEIRRNRRAVAALPNSSPKQKRALEEDTSLSDRSTDESDPGQTTRSGRKVIPPKRLDL